MNDNIGIEQNASFGSKATQIGVQNNYIGLSPGDAAQMAFDIFRNYFPQLKQELLEELKKIVMEMLKEIPKENIVPPSPKIAVPTLQNASITEEPEVRKLYAKLLVSSMDKTAKDGIHPGYVTIINQLCSDEAKVLYKTFQKVFVPIITMRQTEQGNDNYAGIDIMRNFSDIGEFANCEKPYMIGLYFDNLIRLGLIENPKLSTFSLTSTKDNLRNHPFVEYMYNEWIPKIGPHHKIIFLDGVVTLTDFGRNFCRICMG